MKQPQIIIGGPQSMPGLKVVAKRQMTTMWSCGQHTKKGDFLFVYALKPESAIIATAKAASDAKRDKIWRFAAKIKNVKILARPISREELIKQFPDWGWPKEPRMVNYLNDSAIAQKLLKLGKRKREAMPTVDADVVELLNRPTTTRTLIAARVGQGKFRKDVLKLWEHRCAVTGSEVLDAIRASHIKPWNKSTNRERLDPQNGLPLVANLDALFDAGLITFDNSGTIRISPKLPKSEQKLFRLSGLRIRQKMGRRMLDYLRIHQMEVFGHTS